MIDADVTWVRRLERERAARKEAERILEVKSRELYEANQALRRAQEGLEERVFHRTRELAEVSSRLQLILDSATQVSIIATDPVGVIRVFNAGAELLLGYSANEMVGRATPEVFHLAEEVERRGRELSRELGREVSGFEVFIARARTATYDAREWTYVCKGGARRVVHLVVTEVRDADGICTGFLGIATDITARRAAEQRLAVDNAVTRALAESGTVQMAVARSLDAIGRLLGWDAGNLFFVDDAKSVLRLLDGWAGADEAADFVAQKSTRLFPLGVGLPGHVWENRQPVWIPDLTTPAGLSVPEEAGRCGLRSAFALPIVVDGEVRGVLELFSLRVRESDPEVILSMLDLGARIGQYIERKQAEERLRDRDARIRAIVESAADSIILIDQRGVIEAFNPAAERMFGYTGPEIIGNNVSVLMDEYDRSRHDSYLAAYLQGGPSRVIGNTREANGRRKDGTLFPIELTVSELRGGTDRRFTGIIRDVSQRKRAEADLKQAIERATAATQAKSDFLANMSHEVRTPMTAIIGYAEVLFDQRLTAEDREAAVLAIRRNGTHLLQLINDILDISKIEAGKLDIFVQSCAPWPLLLNVLSALRVSADEKGVELDVRAEGRVPRVCNTDPARVRQILVNFLSNAVKFSEPGQRVSVRMGADCSTGTLWYEVRDQGIGMTAEQLGRLFRPFEQADSSSTRKYGGTGLGLSISKRLAEALGGSIQVQSEPGQGSRFRLVLPLKGLTEADWVEGECLVDAVSEAEPGESTVQAAPPALTGRVLVAEDSKDIERVLAYYLGRAGLDVEFAANGREAVKKALGGTFDLILMDMQMPVLDGVGATMQLRKAGYVGPIIALTAHAMSGDRSRFMKAGLTDYLTKPIAAQSLFASLARHLPEGRPPAKESDQRCGGESFQADEELADLARHYAMDLPVQVAAIRTALAAGDRELVTTLSHRIKGTAGMLGFPAVGKAAGLAEQAVRDEQDDGRIGELIDQLESALPPPEGG